MTDFNTPAFQEHDNAPEDGIRRPVGTYDNVIVFIERFPLRIVVFFVGIGLIMHLAVASNDMSGDALFGAMLGYIVGFILVFAELVLGKLTRFIKDMLIRIVMTAEKNSEVL